MPAAQSSMLPLGTLAPDFELQDVVSGDYLSLDDIRKEFGVLVMFICVHCPYVRNIEEEKLIDAVAELKADPIYQKALEQFKINVLLDPEFLKVVERLRKGILG